MRSGWCYFGIYILLSLFLAVEFRHSVCTSSLATLLDIIVPSDMQKESFCIVSSVLAQYCRAIFRNAGRGGAVSNCGRAPGRKECICHQLIKLLLSRGRVW
ncbi:hypothetical protein BDW68DRAFT_139177 [Aspergillus falconensis]